MNVFYDLLTYLKINIIDILLIVVGASAFITYLWQRKAERKTAATIILEQIDASENTISYFRKKYIYEKQKIDHEDVYLSKNLNFDAWEKYQHLLIKEFTPHELSVLNDFFDSVYTIEKTRSSLNDCYNATWNSKAFVTQWMCGKYHDTMLTTPDEQEKMLNEFISANKNTPDYIPNLIYDNLCTALIQYKEIRDTVAYQKLVKISFRKNIE